MLLSARNPKRFLSSTKKPFWKAPKILKRVFFKPSGMRTHTGAQKRRRPFQRFPVEGLLEEHGSPREAMVSELLQEANTHGRGSPTLGQGPGAQWGTLPGPYFHPRSPGRAHVGRGPGLREEGPWLSVSQSAARPGSQ